MVAIWETAGCKSCRHVRLAVAQELSWAGKMLAVLVCNGFLAEPWKRLEYPDLEEA